MGNMMILFGILVAIMMLLCVASAAGVFPNTWSRKRLDWFLNKKPCRLLHLLEREIRAEKNKMV